MKTTDELLDRELVERNYKVAYYVAQNAIEEGITPSTIRSNTLKAEKFERRLKHETNVPVNLRAIIRVAKWMGIEDAIAGRAENPQVDDFGEIDLCSFESPSRSVGDLYVSLAGEDDDLT
jgi:hypothetical protein